MLKLGSEIDQRFEESLQGGKLVKNLEIFGINNNNIIEELNLARRPAYDLKNYKDLRDSSRGGQLSTWQGPNNSLLNLHNSSHHYNSASFNNIALELPL